MAFPGVPGWEWGQDPLWIVLALLAGCLPPSRLSLVLTGFVSSDWSSGHSDQEEQPLRAGLSPPLSTVAAPVPVLCKAWPGAEQLRHCLKLTLALRPPTLALDFLLSTGPFFATERQ